MTDIVTGLTTEEVNKLKEQGLDNIPVGNQSKTIGQIIAGNVFSIGHNIKKLYHLLSVPPLLAILCKIIFLRSF